VNSSEKIALSRSVLPDDHLKGQKIEREVLKCLETVDFDPSNHNLPPLL